ncbi:oligopeptide/dipeptide ABC transporter, ATPase subunit [Alkaliphilus metalliredigens QYMF]|uniref:Oligopeptide/dipeptide ABC transporter, ATPase subunit n=1 Tax=Alkaliphilus metalliredigens (strain QYMF) TaxID=293826 RepID=A6TS87_ALKMQ|nr:oligopeptide/dipeptide ABC transporter ATP-binding protein [Alkaliphilus metalliredigens]ABR49055.1 oligopeptide/dipeptide ABC transporter, ATPase subunit [Alkaliphilus metalliredigens QYMF]
MSERLIEVRNLKKYFNTKKGLLHAVDDVNFFINKGETLGLVGESGCGKSTTGRVLLRLLEPTAGEVIFEGKDIVQFDKNQMRDIRKEMQIVFQDPFASLNPRMSVSEIIGEPLVVNKIYKSKVDLNKKVNELMGTVGLAERLVNVYPHELDGGRRQRIGIARALALNPKFIVQDEPVSALDVSIQAQILNLMGDLQKEFGLTYMFISHDLGVVKHVSDRIAVMYLGQVVELSEYNTMFKSPIHPYTQALLSAIPVPSIDVKKERIILEGDVPSPINPPDGCRFYGRCRYRQEICKSNTPELRDMGDLRFVACHFAGDLKPRKE